MPVWLSVPAPFALISSVILWRMVVAGGHVKPRRSGSEFQLRQVDRGRGIGSPQENVIERLVIHHGIYQIEVQAASRVSIC